MIQETFQVSRVIHNTLIRVLFFKQVGPIKLVHKCLLNTCSPGDMVLILVNEKPAIYMYICMFLAPKNAYRLFSNTDLGWNPIPANTNNNFCHSHKVLVLKQSL